VVPRCSLVAHGSLENKIENYRKSEIENGNLNNLDICIMSIHDAS